MSQYPKVKYHEDQGQVIVHTEVEEAQLGDNWHDSPADYGHITAPSQAQLRDKKYGFKKVEPSTGEPIEEQGEGEDEAEGIVSRARRSLGRGK